MKRAIEFEDVLPPASRATDHQAQLTQGSLRFTLGFMLPPAAAGSLNASTWIVSSRTKGKVLMTHEIYRVTSFQIVGPYKLQIAFDDQTEQTIDFQPILAGELYRPLRDLHLFNRVRIDAEVHTLVWPNGADFDPATLHDWPQLQEAMIERARRWELVPAGS